MPKDTRRFGRVRLQWLVKVFKMRCAAESVEGADGTLEARSAMRTSPLAALRVAGADGAIGDRNVLLVGGLLPMMRFLKDRVDEPFRDEPRAHIFVEGRVCLDGEVDEV